MVAIRRFSLFVFRFSPLYFHLPFTYALHIKPYPLCCSVLLCCCVYLLLRQLSVFPLMFLCWAANFTSGAYLMDSKRRLLFLVSYSRVCVCLYDGSIGRNFSGWVLGNCLIDCACLLARYCYSNLLSFVCIFRCFPLIRLLIQIQRRTTPSSARGYWATSEIIINLLSLIARLGGLMWSQKLVEICRLLSEESNLIFSFFA